MHGLTEKQRAVLEYIESYIELHGFSPSYREIQDHFKLASIGSVSKYIAALIRKGYLATIKSAARSLILKKKRSSSSLLPTVGTFSLSDGLIIFDKMGSEIEVPDSLVPNSAWCYILSAGSDLTDYLIAQGDLLIVEARSTASGNEIALGLDHGMPFFSDDPPAGSEIQAVLISIIRAHPTLARNRQGFSISALQ
ncbi:MAG: repressor LexA [Simkaniaceae bacterium]|nr:repressor LexA [Simkaniaceae bacterium]